MQYQGSSISEGEPVQKMKKVSIPKATDSELDIFYSDLSKAKRKACAPIIDAKVQ